MKNSEFILKYIEQHNTSCYKVAQATGISESTFSKWKANPTSKVDLSIVQKIATFFDTTIDNILETNQPQGDALNLSTDELRLLSNYKALNDLDKTRVSERAEMLAELAAERAAQEAKTAAKKAKNDVDSAKLANAPQKIEKHSIMYFDYPASAGTGLFLDETIAEEISVCATPQSYNADFAIPISGDSMEPEFSSGDIVLIESSPNVPIGKVGIFVLDGDVFIKEYGGDCLISYNEKYPPIMLKDYEAAICLGRVLGKAEIIE